MKFFSTKIITCVKIPDLKFMLLPFSPDVSSNRLSRVFEKKTNSYKFYWFLIILERVQQGEKKILLNDIAIDIFNRVWYPLNYYKLSFGKQDNFKKIKGFVDNKNIVLDDSINSRPVMEQLKILLSKQDFKLLEISISNLLSYVPYRFLRPFFAEETFGLKESEVNEAIRSYSNKKEVAVSPYFFEKDSLVIHDNWFDYFQVNYKILVDFTTMNLVHFLEKHNPLVIGIASKLERPKQRDLKNYIKSWSAYQEEHSLECIYSGEKLIDSFSLDHFIPWSYYTHDHSWNLIPTSREINSRKGNRLPDTSKYLNEFTKIQFSYFQFNLNRKEYSSVLNDYTFLFDKNLSKINSSEFEIVLSKEINNLYQRALNCGFEKWMTSEV